MLSPNQTSARNRRNGFTLVELLAVVVIIGILIAILVPAVSAVRRNARETATRAALRTLSTGLEAFRADQAVGGKHPPSASDNRSDPYEVKSPYALLNGYPKDEIEISGAGLLVWALAGADLLGTPGFRPFRSGSTEWSEDTDPRYSSGSPANSGAYALNDNREPVHRRVGPFVDLSTVNVTRWADDKQSFVIPAEAEVAEDFGERVPFRTYPMFLDSFDRPILYWRADRAGVRIADTAPSNVDPDERGIYHFYDNAALLTPDVSSPLQGGPLHSPLLLSVAHTRSEPHDLNLDGVPSADPQQLLYSTQEKDAFARFILDPDVAARSQPQNADSYLLLSAGADGVYGTADDLANFEPNGREGHD